MDNNKKSVHELSSSIASDKATASDKARAEQDLKKSNSPISGKVVVITPLPQASKENKRQKRF